MQIFEILTALSHLSLQCELPLHFSQSRLLTDYYNLIKEFGGEQHSRHDHHDGGWKAIGLITSGGDVYTDKLIPGKPFLETPAMGMCPYIKEILTKLPGSKRRVRLMFLEPGSVIKWHRDKTDTLDGAISSRFYITIITKFKIVFIILKNILLMQIYEF
ncbi:aspartyl/asparaginyl beta-hydroxylase domain-containing protein [Moorena producens JHB]|uniref:Aspartyl/asparaginyl beta-hydroxylase domain-containing protein n=1 Tax=Moorena producens (strain JHB) TaxID=1454205 RepID=A0A1D9FVK8_MOOP1|nr:aspartyl/asparaginyl beta-hydroxylase domain-containing protein [Moorena producens]AOY79371.1 aspartyl/asparaginyl beta-hydroxylase domain-containing protein [Moorena producens JHB]